MEDLYAPVTAPEPHEAAAVSTANIAPSFASSKAFSVALAAARKAAPSGLVLVSPATGWDRTALGSRLDLLLSLPDWLLGLIIGISMMYKAIRVDDLRRWPKEVGIMTAQVLLAFAGLAIGLFLLVQVIVPFLPAD